MPGLHPESRVYRSLFPAPVESLRYEEFYKSSASRLIRRSLSFQPRQGSVMDLP